jgi:hypothetical protein
MLAPSTRRTERPCADGLAALVVGSYWTICSAVSAPRMPGEDRLEETVVICIRRLRADEVVSRGPAVEDVEVLLAVVGLELGLVTNRQVNRRPVNGCPSCRRCPREGAR